MIGVLVDVSGSMRSAYAVDTLHRANVERTHAVLTTVSNIVNQEVVRHQRQESIFVTAFGLNRPCETCDLIAMLKFFEEFEKKPRQRAQEEYLMQINYREGHIDGHKKLIELAEERGFGHISSWIRKHLSQSEARVLSRALLRDESRLSHLSSLIPYSFTTGIATAGARTVDTTSKLIQDTKEGIFNSRFMSWIYPEGRIERRSVQEPGREETMVRNSEAYKYAKEIIADMVIEDAILERENPKPQNVQDVAAMLDRCLNRHAPSPSARASVSSEDVEKLLEPIKPYIYGGTPMQKAFHQAERMFIYTSASHKVLFVLSDGQSGDGDPLDCAQKLRHSGVTIATCYLTSDPISNPRSLRDSSSPPSMHGQKILFQMSSSMLNMHTPVSYLIDADWDLPPSGESRLFIQANSLDIVNEFCEIVVSQLTDTSCDALVLMIGKVPLATYVNQENAEFEPKKQVGGTCYANAIAAVFHLAIVHREGPPSRDSKYFYSIRKRLIDEFGAQGANMKTVLEKVCKEYRLHYRQVDEIDARKAINKRRPVVATYWLYGGQWDKFKGFYRGPQQSKQILTRQSIQDESHTNRIGHAVVLIRCDPKCLTFMNSWGQSFADGGFFRVKDQNVLNDTKFYDIYWTEQDLTPSEREAYARRSAETVRDLATTFPSIQDLQHECPHCKQTSKVGEYLGNVLEAKCPKCYKVFTPTRKELMESLYSNAS